MIVLIIIIIILISIRLIDLLPQFYTWQSRIKIGRWSDFDSWHQAIQKKSRVWLKNTPTVKLTDQNRLIVLDIIRGNYKRSAIQHWQQASLLLGLSAEYKRNQDASIKKEIEEFISSKIDSSGNWKEPILETDGVILGYALIQIDWLDHHHMKPAYDSLWLLVQNLIEEDETVSYKKHTQDYRFVDTIGFICPFLINYGQIFNISNAVDLGIKQIEDYRMYGMLYNTQIPCHTYMTKTKLPAGQYGWGRGLGWYAIGLIDAWNALGKDDHRKVIMERWVVEFAKEIVKHQRDNGSWGWIVMDKNSRADSSTAATLSWFLKNCFELSEVNETAKQSYQKAIKYLMSVTCRDGAIDFSQGDTKGVGVYAMHFDKLPFAQGFVLRMLGS